MSSLPSLSVPVLNEIESLEDNLKKLLKSCHDDNSQVFDEERARRALCTYTGKMFELQADFYYSLNEPNPYWVEEIKQHVTQRVVTLIPANFRESFRATAWGEIWFTLNQHRWKPPHRGEDAGRLNIAPKAQPNKTELKETRTKLSTTYLNSFQEKIVVLDVCWAAHQRYREWLRWHAGELKDAAKASRAFKALLTSGKRPKEYRLEERPKGWK